MKKKTFLAFIGGTGLYDLPGISNIEEVFVETPFGKPSDNIITGVIDKKPVAFLARHGRGHKFLPSEINYQANIYALKKLGVTHILGVSAVGSLKHEYEPGCAVVPSQILDMTHGRASSFMGKGIVGHTSFGHPYCPQMQKVLLESLQDQKINFFKDTSLVCINGPRFSTRAESQMYKNMGCGIIGMTVMPEAILAREAEMAYATLAFVTDYDSWREEEDVVTVEMVMQIVKNNVEKAKRIALDFCQKLPAETENSIFQASQYSIMTNEKNIPAETKENLKLLFAKYW